jgi:stress-induced-phosphoprotein 1
MDKEKAKQASALAKEAFAKKDYPTAIKHYSEAISFDPTDHLLFSNRSACYASLEQYQDALDDGKKCVELKPDFVRGYGRKGLAEFYLNQYEEAEKTYTAGLKLDPTNEQFKEGLQKAKNALMGPGSFPGAEAGSFPGGPAGSFPGGPPGASSPFGNQQEILQKLLTDPETKEYFKDKDFLAKMKLCQTNPQMLFQLMQSDPRFMKVFTVLTGVSMDDLQNAAKEQKEGKDEGKQAPMDTGAEFQPPPMPKTEAPEPPKEAPKPSAEEAKLTPAEKEELLKKKQAEDEKRSGNDAYKAKKFDEAIGCYDKAISLSDKEPIYHLNKASVYLEMKKFEEALKSCDEAVKVTLDLNPRPLEKLAKAYARKGNVYCQMNKLPEAIEMYERSLLEVNDPQVKELKKKIEQQKKTTEENEYINPELAEKHRENGNKLFRDGNYAAAIKEYDEAIKRSPKSAVMYFNRALSLMKIMDYPRALVDMQKCIELDPKYVKAYPKMGAIHFFMKEYHKALADYDKGLQIEPGNLECIEGKQKTNQAVYQSPPDEDRAKRAMDDPEIRAILSDPRIQQVLKEVKENPNAAVGAMSDPFIAQALQKLIAAGILGVK